MLTYVQGNLFESPARVLVNAVNTMGVMGRGVAKQFRDIYPEMYASYRRACARKDLSIGGLMLHRTPHKSILNFPTKQHWLYPSKLEYIEAGLQTFVTCHERYALTSVAFPQLGCGTGGLDWESEVRPLMEHYLAALPVDAFVYIHDGPDRPGRREMEALKSRLVAEPLPVPFRSVWTGVVARIEQLTVQKASSGSEWWMDQEPGEGEPVICLRTGNGVLRIEREMLFDLWKQLLAHGFLLPVDLSGKLADAAEPLFDLLSGQPWIDRAVLAMDRRDLGSVQSRGIMFVAPTSSTVDLKQVGLFRDAEVAECPASPTPMRSRASWTAS